MSRPRLFPIAAVVALAVPGAAEMPTNEWRQLAQDASGARRGSAIRYAPGTGAFFLWGFFDHDPELLQELPVMPQPPEYDVVSFAPAEARWRNHLPPGQEREWSRQLPVAYLPRTYAAITTGSERTVLRGASDARGGVPRPDLNVVFDQVAWYERLRSLVYFTGGLTAAYDPARRFWTDLAPRHSPPPVLGGSLAFDSTNKELILFGGGHVAERGPAGNLVGYTGTWVYRDRDWRRLASAVQTQPPPRMNSRMVENPRQQVLVLFGGDGQSHYLGDTWIYDERSRTWRPSRARQGPPPRAGHFTVYDPATGWVIIGGGYSKQGDLTDMWAYDAAADQWYELPEARTPVGFYMSADIAPDQNLIVLTTNTRHPDDQMTCNELYPVRTTYGFRIDAGALRRSAKPAATVYQPAVRRRAVPSGSGPARVALETIPTDQWVPLSGPAHGAPVRTWGSATFDNVRGEILYWGGGHCGYGGSDVDAFTVATQQWRAADPAPEFPERAWNKGSRPAGVTFQGAPWMDHGRRIYAFDPVSQKMIMARTIRSTTGYDPELLRAYPAKRTVPPDAIVQTPSSYTRFATFAYDTQTGHWSLLGPAPLGLDTLVSTPRGVMGVNVDWPSRNNDAGYMLPWNPDQQPPHDTALYLFEAAQSRWRRLGGAGPSPQNLYEMTSLAYDTKRDRLLLHGAGAARNELWSFDMRTSRWSHLAPPGEAPEASREAVYLPRQDVMLLCGVRDLWEYNPTKNSWRRLSIPSAATSGQNRAMVYDVQRDLVLLVTGTSEGRAAVFGMRYSGR